MTENQPAAPIDVAGSIELPKPKIVRRRIKKLDATDTEGFPGVNSAIVKKSGPDFDYSIYFIAALSGDIGTASEVSSFHEFASQLDAHAREKHVGNVTAIAFADNVSELVLKLITTEVPANHGAPAKNAFSQLREFLDSARLFNQRPVGDPVLWKAKVNGTTIVEGHF